MLNDVLDLYVLQLVTKGSGRVLMCYGISNRMDSGRFESVLKVTVVYASQKSITYLVYSHTHFTKFYDPYSSLFNWRLMQEV